MTTVLWFCLFALFAAASSDSEEEEKAPEEVDGAGWFGGPDTVVENPGKAEVEIETKKILEAQAPSSESAARQAQPKTVKAKSAEVAKSGNSSGTKLTDLLIQSIPENGSYAEDLEALRIRVKAIEAEVFKGVMEAAKSADPVAKLSQARADLGEVVKLLESREGHEPGKYAAKLRESLGAEREEIESKVATANSARSKDTYLKILSTLESSVEKLDGIDEDLIAVSSLTKRLESELKEMMDVYIDMKRFNGEPAAQAELLESLSEKQKEWFPDQSEELSSAASSDGDPTAAKPSGGSDRQPPGDSASDAGESPKFVSIRKINDWNERLQMHPVYFYSGSSLIGDSQQREPLKSMAPILKEAVEAGCRVEIRGVSDASGNASRNKALAEARANAVGNELRKLRAVISWSVTAEIDESASATDRNGRRVEVKVAAP